VQELTRAKCMDPVFFFDELDKVSESARGDEIVHTLLHLVDASQNTEYRDRYFHNIDFDLSKAVFAFSCNDLSRVNPVLRNRLKVVHCAAPTLDEKRGLVHSHLLPRALRTIGDVPIALDADAVEELLRRARRDVGVRELDRLVQHVVQTLNVLMLPGGGALLGMKDVDAVLPAAERCPLTCTAAMCRRLLPADDAAAARPLAMYT